MLLISTGRWRKVGFRAVQFQSRNRDAFDFNDSCGDALLDSSRFQSRNRDAFDFNLTTVYGAHFAAFVSIS